jgi:hypothetical protein
MKYRITTTPECRLALLELYENGELEGIVALDDYCEEEKEVIDSDSFATVARAELKIHETFDDWQRENKNVMTVLDGLMKVCGFQRRPTLNDVRELKSKSEIGIVITMFRSDSLLLKVAFDQGLLTAYKIGSLTLTFHDGFSFAITQKDVDTK